MTTDETMGLARLHLGMREAVFLVPKDMNPPRGYPIPKYQSLPDEYVILFHPAYQHGEEPVTIVDGKLREKLVTL